MLISAVESFIKKRGGYIQTKLGNTKYFYHVSPVPNIDILKPMTKKYSEKGTGSEYINRVSLGDGIYSCVQALILPGYNWEYKFGKNDVMKHLEKAKTGPTTYIFHVYQVHSSQIQPANVVSYELEEDRIIYDQTLTGELGYKEKLPCTHMGTIKVRMLSEQEHLTKVKFPYIFYWVPTVTTDNYKELFMAFEISVDSVDGASQLTENLLEQHKTRLIDRWELLRQETKTITAENVKRLMSYYQTGKY